MKSILLLLCLLTAIPALAQDDIQLSGQIMNPTSDYVYLSRFYGILLQGVKKDSVKLDAQGRFSMTLPWSEARVATFATGPDLPGQDYTKLYLTPGDRLVLTADKKDFDKSITYTGTGSTINSYMAKQTVAEKNKYKSMARQKRPLPEAEFIRQADSVRAAELKQLEQHFGPKLSKAERAFIETRKKDITYEWADRFVMHVVNDGTKAPLSAAFTNFQKELPLEAQEVYTSPFLLFSVHYSEFLAREAIRKSPALKEKDESVLRYELIERHLSGQLKRVVLAWHLQEVVMLEIDKAPMQAAYQRFLKEPGLEPEIRDFIVADWTTANRYRRL